MSATERLRALLDEWGVEWDATTGALGTVWTHWDAFNGHRVHAMDNGDGTVEIFGEWDLTPEQAVEATLGRGTCEAMKVPLEWDESWNDMFEGAGHVEIFRWVCSHCGRVLDGGSEYVERDTFCPKCGRQIEWEVAECSQRRD